MIIAFNVVSVLFHRSNFLASLNFPNGLVGILHMLCKYLNFCDILRAQKSWNSKSDLWRLRNPTTIMAYIVQLHNGIYSRSAVRYLERIATGVLDRSKPIILVAHQFTGEDIMRFNETIRQLNVSPKTLLSHTFEFYRLVIQCHLFLKFPLALSIFSVLSILLFLSILSFQFYMFCHFCRFCRFRRFYRFSIHSCPFFRFCHFCRFRRFCRFYRFSIHSCPFCRFCQFYQSCRFYWFQFYLLVTFVDSADFNDSVEFIDSGRVYRFRRFCRFRRICRFRRFYRFSIHYCCFLSVLSIYQSCRFYRFKFYLLVDFVDIVFNFVHFCQFYSLENFLDFI